MSAANWAHKLMKGHDKSMADASRINDLTDLLYKLNIIDKDLWNRVYCET